MKKEDGSHNICFPYETAPELCLKAIDNYLAPTPIGDIDRKATPKVGKKKKDIIEVE